LLRRYQPRVGVCVLHRGTLVLHNSIEQKTALPTGCLQNIKTKSNVFVFFEFVDSGGKK
jgi:hypothetical protein